MTHRQLSAFAIVLVVVLGTLLLAAPARAEDGAAEREIKAVKRKIEELQHAAKQAQRSGDEDKAHELATRARELTERLEAFFERRAKEGAGKPKKHKAKPTAKTKRKANPKKTIHSLSMAMESLKALGGHEALIQQLAQAIEHIKHRARDEHARRRHEEELHEKELHERERRAEDRIEKERHAEGTDEDRERAGLRWRVETMRMAIPALREGEQGKLVAILERAIRTGELLLEGREDEKARKAFSQTPALPELAEVLMVSAKLWREFGNGEKAARVHKLSRYYAERSEGREAEEYQEEHDRGSGELSPREARNRESRERGRREREDVRRHDDRRSHEIQELRAHLQHLRKQIEDLARHLEKLGDRR